MYNSKYLKSIVELGVMFERGHHSWDYCMIEAKKLFNLMWLNEGSDKEIRVGNYEKESVKNPVSSSDISPIMHSKPQQYNFYWVGKKDSSEQWEVAQARIHKSTRGMHFWFTNGAVMHVSKCNWKRNPIVFNEANCA